jgi:Protein of unknown function (DUF2844)
MKLRIIQSVLVMMSLPLPSLASLGGDTTSVRADQEKMQGTLRTSSGDAYTLHEMQTANGVAVKEYVSPAGKVFAVSWQGPVHPDLRQLLGPYFDEYVQGIQQQREQRRGHGPLLIQHAGLVVQVSGHVRGFVGKAYVPQQMPAGVRAEDLR